MSVEAARRERYQRAARVLAEVTGVEAADVIEHDPRLNRPSIEILVGPEYVRVPPRVLRAIAECDLGLWDSSPKAEYHVLVIT